MIGSLGKNASERRYAASKHVHRMGRGRQRLERSANRGWEPAPAPETSTVGGEFGGGRQLTVYEKMCNFLELTGLGDIEDVVAAVVKIVARASHGAQRGVTRDDARQSY